MRLTKKELRKIMAEVLNEYGLATPGAPSAPIPPAAPAATDGSPDGEMWNAWFDMRVPTAWGRETWPQYLEGMDPSKHTVGWKLEPDPAGGQHLAVIVPANATELAGMFKSSDRTFYYVSTGIPNRVVEGSVVEPARFEEILSWLRRNWPTGENDKIEIPRTLISGTPDRAKSFEIDPNSPVYEGRLNRNALRQMILREMRAVSDPTEFENPGELGNETLYYEPGVTDTPTADTIADAVEGIQDQGLLSKIWDTIKGTIDPSPGSPEEEADAQAHFEAMLAGRKERMKNPKTLGDKVNKFLQGVPDAAFDDLGTLSEGYEPGSYRAEGDRKLTEVSVGVSRWNTLAGTDK